MAARAIPNGGKSAEIPATPAPAPATPAPAPNRLAKPPVANKPFITVDNVVNPVIILLIIPVIASAFSINTTPDNIVSAVVNPPVASIRLDMALAMSNISFIVLLFIVFIQTLSQVAFSLLVLASTLSRYIPYLSIARPLLFNAITSASFTLSQFSIKTRNLSRCLTPAIVLASSDCSTLPRLCHLAATSSKTSDRSLNSRLVSLSAIPCFVKIASTLEISSPSSSRAFPIFTSCILAKIVLNDSPILSALCLVTLLTTVIIEDNSSRETPAI